MKKNKILIFVLTLMLVSLPIFAFAADWSGLVPCGKSGGTEVQKHPCTFNDALTLINTIINFTFGYLVVPIAAIMFAFAGFKLITAGGESSGARSEAKAVFTNTVIGLIIAAGCFIIIKTLLVILGYNFAGDLLDWF